MDAAAQYALAYALTTTAGVRAVLSLAALALVVHLHWLMPPAGFTWLAAPATLWILGGIAVVEILADKVPVLDHALHVVQIAVKPAAAAILVGGSVHAQSHALLVTLMVLGALNALGIHAGVASLRGASTLMTGGIANPVVSAGEDAGTLGSLVLAFFAPFIAAFVAVCFTVALAVLARSAFRRSRRAPADTLRA